MAIAVPSSSILHLSRHRPKWSVISPLASSFSSQSTPATPPPPPLKKLILYSKPGCCLCDGLKEKLQSAFTLSGPDSLHGVQLQVRDITSNTEWEGLYQYEIPVLARVRFDGTEITDVEIGLKQITDVNVVSINWMKVEMIQMEIKVEMNLVIDLTWRKLTTRLGSGQWPGSRLTAGANSRQTWPGSRLTAGANSRQIWPGSRLTAGADSGQIWPGSRLTAGANSRQIWPGSRLTAGADSGQIWPGSRWTAGGDYGQM
ncbi:hypothetical protein GIB67_003039 [Kingdonia uniflora]|uniref:Glutaredoxin-like protein n=1 Tax=Kingdonia uniflora TaxID=39325 RepID=A0A7J7LYW2_9MAGN|nr:hypothetical protein GIB67_003039 [Kingdonia uniflora]